MRRILIQFLCTGIASGVVALGANSGDAKSNNSTVVFHVALVEGDGALNSLPSRSAENPVVRVADGAGRPLAGARVEFEVPKSGPGATFGANSTHYSTVTDSDGVAKVEGLRNNGVPGVFSILVHVSYQGHSVADSRLHQTNLAPPNLRVAARPQQEAYPDASMQAAVLGVAMGDEFLVNGVATLTNANLAPGNRLQTKDSPVTIYAHDHCEFLVGPHSSVTVEPHLLSVGNGAVRVKRFGDCKLGSSGFWVTSQAPNADAVLALTADHMEVGAMTGAIEVSNAVTLVNTVQPGAVASFRFANASSPSGATVNPKSSSNVALMMGIGATASLLGLGLAADALAQNSSASSTSP